MRLASGLQGLATSFGSGPAPFVTKPRILVLDNVDSFTFMLVDYLQYLGACVEVARQREILEVMAITANEDFFKAVGFDFTLARVKKALFIQTREQY